MSKHPLNRQDSNSMSQSTSVSTTNVEMTQCMHNQYGGLHVESPNKTPLAKRVEADENMTLMSIDSVKPSKNDIEQLENKIQVLEKQISKITCLHLQECHSNASMKQTQADQMQTMF